MNDFLIKNEVIYVRKRNGYEAVNRKDVLYFEASGKKVFMYSIDECTVVHISIKDLETLLTETSCRRTHRSFIVNFKYVSVIKRQFVILNDKTKLPVGRKFSHALRQWFCKAQF